MTEDHASKFPHGEFKLSITQAMADQLEAALNRLTPAALTTEYLKELEVRGGVYELYLRGERVYVGKASDDLPGRLSQHRRKVSGRAGIELADMGFKCLYVDEDLEAAAPERLLIKEYKKTGSAPWNTNGFGSKDPGVERDTTMVKAKHFDALYPADLDLTIQSLEPGLYPIKKYLQAVKDELPFNLRFPREKKPYIQEDGSQPSVEVPERALPARELIRMAIEALPEGWQATALPGYVILYREDRDYKSARVFWRKHGGETIELLGQNQLDLQGEVEEDSNEE
ncbi:Eco29kI family restriction endonuclease [Haloactinomyces albus]|uniref:GIY-YIG domain-containing protein n=1 Tax=Haloactinomyces albus TaxID=1352928 RepID=A0AAE3ZEP0_9ACTN|nr:Eco29kI family restriction endonuclease [Haloactinomyces albus]MDR7302258.1 hypothetical protein [Haloactinomyces albus]